MTTVPMEPVAAPEPRWRALRGTNLADRLYRGVLTTLAICSAVGLAWFAAGW